MNKNSIINLRISVDQKETFRKVCAWRNLGVSEVLSAFIDSVNEKGSLPIHLNRFLPKQPMKQMLTLSEIKSAVSQIAQGAEQASKIKKIYLFGSYSRGEATQKSDVDLLVDFEKGVTLFDIGNLQDSFEKALGKEVDVVSRKSMEKDPYFASFVNKDKICIYERM